MRSFLPSPHRKCLLSKLNIKTPSDHLTKYRSVILFHHLYFWPYIAVNWGREDSAVLTLLAGTSLRKKERERERERSGEERRGEESGCWRARRSSKILSWINTLLSKQDKNIKMVKPFLACFQISHILYQIFGEPFPSPFIVKS